MTEFSIPRKQPWFLKFIGRMWKEICCSDSKGINITFQRQSRLPFWQHWGTSLSSETWTHQHHSSIWWIIRAFLLCLQALNRKKEKKKELIMRVHTKTHQRHFSTSLQHTSSFEFSASFELGNLYLFSTFKSSFPFIHFGVLEHFLLPQYLSHIWLSLNAEKLISVHAHTLFVRSVFFHNLFTSVMQATSINCKKSESLHFMFFAQAQISFSGNFLQPFQDGSNFIAAT